MSLITFHKMAWVWWTKDFGTKDVSLGLHICWAGRVDIHILFGMLSLGRVPIYQRGEVYFAASNSYHEDRVQQAKERVKKKQLREFRAGVPNHL